MAQGMVAWISRVAAVVLPLAVLGGTWATLDAPPETTGVAAEMDEKLKLTRPRLLVLGSSLAKRDIQLDLLGRRLDVSSRQMLMLTLPNSNGAHWYSVLKNRVFGGGYEPKTIVVVGALGDMITNEVLGDANQERLINQLGPDEPVIAKKVYGLDDPSDFRWQYLEQRAGQLRADSLAYIRDYTVGTLFTNGRDPITKGQERGPAAFESVFAAERMDYSLHKGASAGLFAEEEELEYTRDVEPRDSFVPDLVALAKEHGANIAFVRVPFPPSNKTDDKVPPDVEKAAEALFAELGVGYIDMRQLALNETFFEDMVHMNSDGSRIVTNALADALVEWDMLGEGVASVASPGMGMDAPKVSRVGDLPVLAGAAAGPCTLSAKAGAWAAITDDALAEAGFPGMSPIEAVEGASGAERVLPRGAVGGSGCVGASAVAGGVIRWSPTAEGAATQARLSPAAPLTPAGAPAAWWVYPGTKLVFEYSGAWQRPPEEFAAFAIGTPFGGGKGAPILRIAGQDFPFERAKSRWFVTARPSAPTAAWTIEIDIPKDGPYFLVQNLAVGLQPKTTHVVGQAESMFGATVRMIGGKSGHIGVEPTFEGELPALAAVPRVRLGPRDIGLIFMPEYGPLADVGDANEGNASACSPIRLLEDGKPLPLPHTSCTEVAVQKGGRYCHTSNNFFFTASDDSLPTTNGRTYSLDLEPSRRCSRFKQKDATPLRDVWWLYPRNKMRFRIPADRLQQFFDGANRFELEATSFMPAEDPGKVRVELLVRGKPVISEDLVMRELWRVKAWDLPEAIRPRETDVEVVLTSLTDDNYLLVTLATLSENYDYGFISAAQRGARELAVEERKVMGDPVTFRPKFSPAVAEALFPYASVTRAGTSADLGKIKRPEEVDPDLIEGHLFPLWPISNSVLQNAGYGSWSPLALTIDGKSLRSIADRREFKSGCEDCFLHIGQSIVYKNIHETESIVPTLDARVPLPTAEGQEVYWVYPGTSLRFRFDKKPPATPLLVTVEGQQFVPLAGAPGRAGVAIGTDAAAIERADVRYRAELVASPKGAGWELEVRSPQDGPWLSLFGVYVGSEERVNPIFTPVTMVNPDAAPIESLEPGAENRDAKANPGKRRKKKGGEEAAE